MHERDPGGAPNDDPEDAPRISRLQGHLAQIGLETRLA